MIGNIHGKGNKGKKHTQETKNKISNSKLGKKFNQEFKNKLSKAMKGKKQSESTKKKRAETMRNKTFQEKAESVKKRIATMKKNGTLSTSKPEKISINKFLLLFSNDFIAHPTKNELLKINPKLINYPGCSPDGFLISKNAFVEFQYYWTHGGHPYDPNSDKDKLISKLFLEKSKQGHYAYDKAYHNWTYRDPLKRKWCKENNFTLLEFFSEKDLDDYLASQNKSVKTIDIVNKS